jgi:hypothetical protein
MTRGDQQRSLKMGFSNSFRMELAHVFSLGLRAHFSIVNIIISKTPFHQKL